MRIQNCFERIGERKNDENIYIWHWLYDESYIGLYYGNSK